MLRKIAFSLCMALSLLLIQIPQALAQEKTGEKKSTSARRFEKKLVALVKRIRPAVIAIGGGSGVIISEDGWVLTNHHVAGNEDKTWTVRLPGGRFYDAKITGKDVIGDITLLKITTKDKLPFLPLADSDRVKVGEWVFAMGNPWGFAGSQNLPTVSLGVVSAVHRFQGGYGDAIQTDAPINPGNSGGPLINFKGEVIGINGRIAFRFGQRSNTGVGFAIPANQIKNFMPKLKTAKGKRVDHGEIAGLVVDKKPSDLTGGARVVRVIPKTDAEKVGLKAEDRIIAVEGSPIAHVWRFLGLVSTYPEGTSLKLTVERLDKAGNKVKKEVKVALVVQKGGAQNLDGVLKPVPESPFLGIEPGYMNMKGVQILGIWKSSPADAAGIKPGDTLLRVNGKEIPDGWEFKSLVSALRFGQKVKLTIDQGGAEKVLTLTVGNSSHYPLNSLLRVPEEGKKGGEALKAQSELGFKLGDQGDDGIVVLSVSKGGPAEKGGLKAGDEILSLNGEEAEDAFEMQDFMNKIKVGKEVKLEIFRNGELIDLSFKSGPLKK